MGGLMNLKVSRRNKRKITLTDALQDKFHPKPAAKWRIHFSGKSTGFVSINSLPLCYVLQKHITFKSVYYLK